MPMSPRLLRPRARGGFDPRTLSNLAAWYDPTVTSSYTLATGVSELRDLSGNGRTLTQATGNNQPTITTINGKNALSFDGTNDELVANNPIVTASASGQFTLFLVLRIASTEAGYVIGWNSAGGLGSAIYAQSTPNYTTADATTIPRATSATRGNSVPEVLSLVYNNNATTFAINGTVGGEQAGIAHSFSAGTSNLVIGNRPAGASAGTFLAGTVGAVLIYNRALSESERKRVERYLGGLYGITIT